jgi:diguanylate cyclase (GGDEF)-like protein/PAS domain S-box-containing protein
LRETAEAVLARAPLIEPPVRSADELLHELQVHEIELEMQNEALRQTQEALEESRDRYVDLYEFAPVGYLTLTREGLITEINLTGASMLREIRTKLLQRRFARFVVPGDQDRFQRYFMQAFQLGGKQTCELCLLRSDGTHFDVRLDSLLATSGDAAPALRIALTDISESKEAEAELRIAAITFELQEGVMVTDPNGVIVRVNRAFTSLTGYSAEEAVGRTPAMLNSDRHDQAFFQAMWLALKEKGYWQGEIWNRRKDGKIHAEWLTITAATSPEGIVTNYVGTLSNITENKEAEAEIHRLAYYDALTQLPNRRLLQDRMAQALASSDRSGHYGALLFMDMDHFKVLNDTRGHDIGDKLLVEMAQRILSCVREGDTVARLGGDEFVMILENLSTEAQEAAVQADLVGEKIRVLLSQPYALDGREFHCTTSLGITLFHGHDEPPEALFKHADLALYKAKSAGRNALRFFDPAMQTALNERSLLETDLRLAMKYRQLHLYYQAQINGARRITGAEVLLRWLHPEHGVVSPCKFIPLAEDTGLILPIGQWVLESACAQIKVWSDSPDTRDLQLAVNVSVRQFRQSDFVDQVRQALAHSGADPARLKLELTESIVIDNVDETITRMQEIKALGVGFSMDDFGTGFSSLSYLKRLPLDQLKIDSSFVRDIASDPSDAAIVKTIISMGKTLGLNVIAEGVETEAQLALLSQYGCVEFQGDLFAQPLPLIAFQTFLEKYLR